MSEALPCPFCEGPVHTEEKHGFVGCFHIAERGCPVPSHCMMTIEQWNRRAESRPSLQGDVVERLRAYARRCSIEMMKLSGGGSEMFERIGEEFYAEPELCRERIEHKIEMARKLRQPPSEQEEG